jgi:hypothetical protein
VPGCPYLRLLLSMQSCRRRAGTSRGLSCARGRPRAACPFVDCRRADKHGRSKFGGGLAARVVDRGPPVPSLTAGKRTSTNEAGSVRGSLRAWSTASRWLLL